MPPVSTRAIASRVGKASVSGVENARLTKTSSGVRKSATCSAELMITEIAKSIRSSTASWMPTTFSTALPAIATMTTPAKSWLMCIACVAGVRAATNQSLAKAAATPAPPSRPVVRASGQRALRPESSSSPPPRNVGSVTKKTTISTPAQTKLSVRAGRRVEGVRQRRHREDRRRQHHQGRDHPGPRRAEALRAVPEPADEEGDPEHEHAVCDHRADERSLHHADEAGVQ